MPTEIRMAINFRTSATNSALSLKSTQWSFTQNFIKLNTLYHNVSGYLFSFPTPYSTLLLSYSYSHSPLLFPLPALIPTPCSYLNRTGISFCLRNASNPSVDNSAGSGMKNLLEKVVRKWRVRKKVGTIGKGSERKEYRINSKSINA
jgi:hypothetical protein